MPFSRGSQNRAVLRTAAKRLAPAALRAFVRQPGGAQQGGQLAQLLLRQVAQLADVALAQRLAQLAQQRQARRGDADADDASVVGGALALDEAALLQPVEQA